MTINNAGELEADGFALTEASLHAHKAELLANDILEDQARMLEELGSSSSHLLAAMNQQVPQVAGGWQTQYLLFARQGFIAAPT